MSQVKFRRKSILEGVLDVVLLNTFFGAIDDVDLVLILSMSNRGRRWWVNSQRLGVQCEVDLTQRTDDPTSLENRGFPDSD